MARFLAAAARLRPGKGAGARTLCDGNPPETVFPWLPPNASPGQRTKAAAFVEFGNRQKREQAARFRQSGPNRRVVELANTAHHCFIHRPDEVVKEMRAFLLPAR